VSYIGLPSHAFTALGGHLGCDALLTSPSSSIDLLENIHTGMSSSNTVTFPKGPLPKSYYTDDRGGILLGVASAFLALEVVAFILRAVSRRMRRVAFGWDDALMVPALLMNILLCIFGICKAFLLTILTEFR
jgi:hypothetical protein